MVKRKWLWGKRSSEKMDVETENSGSLSSQSEKYSADQDVSRGSHSNSQSPEITSKETDNEDNGEEKNERLNSLAKKLSDTPIDDGSQDSLSQEDESKVSTDTCSEISDSPKDDLSTNNLSEENFTKTKNECKEYSSSVKLLSEKLSDALLNVSLKDDLVKQHAKVAEEAVAGWEKAEKEATTLRQQLETVIQQKSTVDSRANHLDVALKECVRQLRLARDEQERKITEKTNELELANDVLRKELQAHLDALEIRTIERDLSTKAAETASKQHLESIKKVAKLEAECRKLKSVSRVSSNAGFSSYAESLTDSHSSPTASEAESRKINGSGDCSESWALALITELDQFKSVRSMLCNPCPPVEIDLMDDFLEMERLAALPMRDSVEKPVHEIEGKLRVQIEKMEAEKDELTTALVQTQSCLETSQVQLIETQMMCSMMKSLTEEVDKERALSVSSSPPRDSLENELEKKKKELEIQKYGICNGELRMKEELLIETQECLEKSKEQLREAETKLGELEKQLNTSNEEKNSLRLELEMKKKELIETRECLEKSKRRLSEAETKLGELENQLNASNEEKESLILHLNRERDLWVANSSRCEELENELERKKQELQIQKNAIYNSELEMETELTKTRDGLERSEGQLKEVEMKLGKLEREINAANEEKSTLRLQLDIVQTEVQTMSSQIESLKEQLREERDLAAVFSTKCMELENALHRKANSHNELKLKQEDLETAAGKLADCQKTIASLGTQLKSLATLEDFLIDTASIPGFSPPAPLIARPSTGQPWKLHSNHTFLPGKEYSAHEGPLTKERHSSVSHQHGSSSSSSSLSAYFMNPPGCDQSANGFAKYFSLSRN